MVETTGKLYDLDVVSQTYFFPQPRRPLAQTEDAGPVGIPLEHSLGCYWSRPLLEAPTILYLHGNGESIADQLEYWPQWARQAGANIFFVDYPGYASSAGRPCFSSCRRAALAAMEHVLNNSSQDLFIMGRSVGSIFALDSAWQCRSPRLRGLVLESGIADLKPRLAMRVPYEQVGIDRQKIEQQVNEDYDHRRKIQELNCPVLILHTKNDNLVPAANSEQLAQWAGDKLEQLVLFEQGDHNSIQFYNEHAYRQHLEDFITKGLRP